MSDDSFRKFNEIKQELNALIPSGEYHPASPLSFDNKVPYIVKHAHRLNNKISSYPKVVKTLKLVQPILSKKRPQLPTTAKKKLFTLDFKHFDNPVVSIVIPVFNKFELSVNCLESLSKIPRNIPYEIIVVDNASHDSSLLIGKIKNLVYVRNSTNLGFVDGCNVGAKKARSKYIVFLNNDAEVMEDWLEWLYKTIDNDPTIGIVGSKIMYPDGRLQEAGGIIFSDGSGNNYGKFDHPDRYMYNYVRDVDYCSGASIIIRKDLFEKFGGFDKLYAPAYYEDTDLCFKAREAGFRVVYQPRSVIYHIEGATAGTSTSSGFKKYQAINREKFIKRWSKVLSKKYASADDLYMARDLSGEKLVLIVDENVPTPDKDSGSVRMKRIIEAFQKEGYKVTFLPNYLGHRGKYTDNLQQMGVEVIVEPFHFADFARDYGRYYDVVLLSRPRICAMYLDLCQAYFNKAKIIFDTVDLHYLRLKRQAEFEPKKSEYYREMSEKYEILEKGLMERTDATLLVSPDEIDILRKENVKAPLHILSNIHEINESSYKIGFDGRKDILFVGGYAHLPNIDAVRWFVHEILPIVRKKLAHVKFHVVGADMPDELRRDLKKCPGVVVHGFVQDLEPLLKGSRVFVAPLRFGAGVKGKIGQAIEFAIPVVTTPIGSEGMHLKDRISCVEKRDVASEFADGVISLYSDKKLWESVQKNAKVVLDKNFSAEKTRKDIHHILQS